MLRLSGAVARRRLTPQRVVILAVAVVVMVGGATSGAVSLLSRSAAGAPEHAGTLAPGLATAHVRDATLLTRDIGWRLTAQALEMTHDAGATWSAITPTNVQPGLIRAVYFVDPLHGWLLTSAFADSTRSELLTYRTTDGGQSWLSSQVAAPSVFYSAGGEGLGRFDFLDVHQGWLEVDLSSGGNSSVGRLFRTQDGGATWTQLSLPVAGAIAFTTPSNGWLAGGILNSELYSTHDGGQTWSQTVPPLPAGTPPPIVNGALADAAYTLASQPGAAALRADIPGNPGTALLYHLTSQGTWQLVHTFDDSAIQAQVPVGVPLAVAGPGALTTVLDRGQEVAVAPVTGGSPTSPKSNLPISLDSDVSSLSFFNPRSGWAIVSGTFCAGFKRDCTEYSALYTTSDSGATWLQLPGT